MAYNYQNRLAIGGQRMKEVNGTAVYYIRSGVFGGSIEITAVAILQKADEVIPGVAVTRVENQDWVIDLADLGDFGLPQAGDRIQVVSTLAEYRVGSLDGDSPPFEYLTSSKTRVRVHTNQITE